MNEAIEDFINNMLESNGFTAKSLAEKAQEALNEKIRNLRKDQVLKNENIKGIFIEMIPNKQEIDKPPFLFILGVTVGDIEKSKIIDIGTMDFRKDIIDGMMDRKAKGILKMADMVIPNFSLNDALQKMYESLNTLILNADSNYETGVKCLIYEGKEKANISVFQNKENSFVGDLVQSINFSDYVGDKIKLS